MYKAINGWTKAKIIEQIRLKNNGSKSVTDGNCAYRGDNGNACVVGCFIPDSLYTKDMEGELVGVLLNNYPILEEHMPLPTFALKELQAEHDGQPINTVDVRDTLVIWINQFIED